MGNNGGKGDVGVGIPSTPDTPVAQKMEGSPVAPSPVGFAPAEDLRTSALPAATQVHTEDSLRVDAPEVVLTGAAPEVTSLEPELAVEATATADTAAEAAADAATTAAEVAESVLALTEEAADEPLAEDNVAEPSIAASPFPAPVSSLSQEASTKEESTWTTVWTVSNETPELEPIIPQVSVKAAREKERRTLEQMMSLKPNDDERTAISKKVSWILRHGAKKVGTEIDDEGWVRVKDMLALDIFEGVTEERLLSMVHESNAQKVRYELKDGEGGPAIKALSKELRSEKMKQAREAREAKESYRERQDWQERKDDARAAGGNHDQRGHQREERGQFIPSRLERENRFTKRANPEGGEKSRRNNGLTFEQQLDQGYRPVYQGGSVVAMSRESDTVKPGFRPDSKGKGQDDKGKGKGKRKGKQSFDKESEEAEENGKGRSRQFRWRVSPSCTVIVREGLSVQSDMVATLMPGALVAQVSEDKVLEKGIIRMKVESLEEEGIEGWVTRTAQAAGGPCYFMPDGRAPRMPAKGRGKGFSTEKGGYGWQGGQRR